MMGVARRRWLPRRCARMLNKSSTWTLYRPQRCQGSFVEAFQEAVSTWRHESAVPSRRSRNYCTAERSFHLDQLQELLAAHPAVIQCELIDGVAYAAALPSSSLLNNRIDDWELEEYLSLKLQVPLEALPKIRIVDSFPESEYENVPFTFTHILHVLFEEVDVAGNGQISLEEFSKFCRKTGLFNSSEESVEVFLRARSSPSTSELLFSGGDMFQLQEVEKSFNTMKFYEFQKLMIDAGIVEISAREVQGEGCLLVSFFIEEHVLDVVLRRWFAWYDKDEDNALHFNDYIKLVADYQLPFAVTAESFRQLCIDGSDGIDVSGFRSLLEEANVLKSGASIVKDDEMGHAWRSIQDSQHFLPPTKVFVADGRQGASPPKDTNSLRFVCISDTHGSHRELTWRLPTGDVLLHAGDFTMSGELEEVQDFARWLRSLPFKQKVVIAGNHDLSFDQSYKGNHSKSKSDPDSTRKAFTAMCDLDDSLIYLEDGECSIQGIRIYGSPWQPEFGQWAFNLPRGPELAAKWRSIPEGVDILLVHGPPLGRGDVCLPSLNHSGCADLLAEVQGRIRPAFCVYGHVHEGAGVTFDGVTHYLNACSLNEKYECVHAPFVFDLPIRDITAGGGAG